VAEGLNQLLAMIPVREGREPVRMVEWPGQVSSPRGD
jgi:hypothetical protein